MPSTRHPWSVHHREGGGNENEEDPLDEFAEDDYVMRPFTAKRAESDDDDDDSSASSEGSSSFSGSSLSGSDSGSSSSGSSSSRSSDDSSSYDGTDPSESSFAMNSNQEGNRIAARKVTPVERRPEPEDGEESSVDGSSSPSSSSLLSESSETEKFEEYPTPPMKGGRDYYNAQESFTSDSREREQQRPFEEEETSTTSDSREDFSRRPPPGVPVPTRERDSRDFQKQEQQSDSKASSSSSAASEAISALRSNIDEESPELSETSVSSDSSDAASYFSGASSASYSSASSQYDASEAEEKEPSTEVSGDDDNDDRAHPLPHVDSGFQVEEDRLSTVSSLQTPLGLPEGPSEAEKSWPSWGPSQADLSSAISTAADKRKVGAKQLRSLENMQTLVREALKRVHPNSTPPRKNVRKNVSLESLREPFCRSTSLKQTTQEVSSLRMNTAHTVLHNFEALVHILLHISDELEFWSVFGRTQSAETQSAETVVVSPEALNAVLSHAPALEAVLVQLKPILEQYLIMDGERNAPDNTAAASVDSDSGADTMEILLQRIHLLIPLVSEIAFLVCQRQEWTHRSETAFVTLVELLERTASDISCEHSHQAQPTHYRLSKQLRRAWHATGHTEELKTLHFSTKDMWLFRRVCYEVLLSTDHWCPNKEDLGLVCEVSNEQKSEASSAGDDYDSESRLAPVPTMAFDVIEKVQEEPLQRADTMSSIVRRILPPHAIKDPTMLDAFSIRTTLRNPLGLAGATNMVSITGCPEVWNDQESLGMGGVGKTTMAAMIASHPDVRRYFKDGVAWVYVGSQEMNYARYVECLKELCSQLVFSESIPLFAEMVRVPLEPKSARDRREEGFMVYARDSVAELLRMRNVLIILDNVNFESDLEWFRFQPSTQASNGNSRKSGNHVDSTSPREAFSSSVLITTRRRDLLPAADTVEMNLLSEADAIKLLVQEAGQTSAHIMAAKEEAKAVVRVCANHPLAVKSVGRWLSLKHVTAGAVNSVEEISEDVRNAIDKIVASGDLLRGDMMYEILSMSFSPAVNGKPTMVIKFCFAAFVTVFCQESHHSLFSPPEMPPTIPMLLAEMLFETLLELEEELLFQEGSLFFTQRREATMLIPEALSALGVMKIISSYADNGSTSSQGVSEDNSRHSILQDQKYVQIMHQFHDEYGEYLLRDEEGLRELTKDAERRWNGEFVRTYLSTCSDWDSQLPDASRDYCVEMIVSHMLRAEMFDEAADLLADETFARGRLYTMGRANAARQHITDCEALFTKLREERDPPVPKREAQKIIERAYRKFGSLLATEQARNDAEERRNMAVDAGHAHYEIGFSLAERRCWKSAIAHWEASQELLVASLGMVEYVAAILFNEGAVYAQMNNYDDALESLKRCLRIRGAIHGEEHILYAQTIQKIGDLYLGMSDYTEAMESYNWALDVMHIEPSFHRMNIGQILDNMGSIHYSKGKVPDALRCYQDALRSKKAELGNDHFELASTYQHMGNCLSDQGEADQAIAHFEEAIRLRKLDTDGIDERDADILSIQGVLNNLHGKQEQGLHCYEKCLEILVMKVPHKKEKIAALLHLIGCVYLMNGEQKRAMKLFEESLQARRKVLGFEHLDVASTLFNMAFLHQMRNRLGKALTCLEEALKIREKRLPDSEKVALTQEKIGTLAKAEGFSKKAEVAFKEALRIRKLLGSGDDEAVAAVLHEIGDLMDDVGDYEEAMHYYIEALDIRRNRLGPDHEDVASTLYSMGFTLHNQDAVERALQCFDEALNIRKIRLGKDSKEVGDSLNMMGFLEAKRGEYDEALALLWDALRIRKLQNDLVKVSETLKNIGNVHREKREHELAVECYEECLRIRRAELGDDHEKVADALVAIGNVRSDMEETENAMLAYQEALTIRTLAHGENDEKVAAVLQYMGTMEFRAGDFERARRFLEEFIRIRRENNENSDGDYVNVLFMLGNIHKIEGRDLDAKQCWLEAYDVFNDLGLDAQNPQIAQVMDSLLKGENITPGASAAPPPREESVATSTLNTAKRRGLISRIKDTLREEKLQKYPPV